MGVSDNYLVIANFVLTLSVKWCNKNTNTVTLDRDKLKNTNKIGTYRTTIVVYALTYKLAQSLNKYNRNQGSKEKVSMWLKIKKPVSEAAESLRIKKVGRKNV